MNCSSKLKYKSNISRVIERYKAFWNKDKLDRIPIRIRFPVGNLQANETYSGENNEQSEKNDDQWEDIVLNAEKHLQYWDKQLKIRSKLPDDSIPTAPVDLGPALMCGIMGADIYFKSGASWSNHPLQNWNDIKKYGFNNENKWLKKMLDLTNYFTINSKEKFAVGLSNFMGPTDILTCLRGAEAVCMDFYENPKKIKTLIGKSLDAYIKAVDKQLDNIPRYYNGTCEGYMMWTPGRSNCWLASDLSTMLSPDIYRQFLFEYDQKVIDYFDNTWMHVHSGGVHIVKEFLNLEGLKGIQIVNDGVAGPSIKELLPVLKDIQKTTSLILRKFSIEEIQDVLTELSPAGLFIDTQCDSLEIAEIALEKWNKITSKM